MRKINFIQEIVILAILLILGHLYQYIDSGFNVNCLIRMIVCFVCGLTCLIWGKNIFYILLFVGGLFIMATDQFNNYSIFWIVYLFIRKYPKQKYIAFILYLVDIFIVCEFHDRNASHLFIHILTCLFFYITSEDVTQPSPQELALTDDERKILHQLVSENRTLDDVDGFSKSTVIRKLDNACLRNNCENHAELRHIYRKKKDFDTIVS